MKFAICNETFQDWPFEKAFEFASRCGYQGIEVAPFTINKDVRKISPAERADFRQQATQAGLEILGLHWLLAFTEGFYLTSPEPEVRLQTGDYLADLACFCADLGGNLMVLGSPQQRNLLPGISHTQGMQYAADVIRHAAPMFAERGVTLAIEPLSPQEGDFLNTGDLGAELVDLIDHSCVQLHLDVKAMSSEGTPIADIIRRHADKMVHFHANDANLRGPGMGEIDFVPILQALKDINYDGWVCVEVFDYEPGVEALAKESITYLKECLTQLS